MPGRTDNVSDRKLAAELLAARRGQAFWARALTDLRDADFDGPSSLPGWSRRHVIAHVGFHARALARLVEGARTGIEQPMYSSLADRDAEITFGATLPVEALRNLAAHAAVHLNVEWRDLPEERWSALVSLPDGRRVPVSATVGMRAREVWRHALDLDSGASAAEVRDGLTVLGAPDHPPASATPWCADLDPAQNEGAL